LLGAERTRREKSNKRNNIQVFYHAGIYTTQQKKERREAKRWPFPQALEEVIRGPASDVRFALPWRRIKLQTVGGGEEENLATHYEGGG